MKWFNTLSHNRWLEQETDRIFDFGKNSVVPTGFGWLGNKGQIKEEMGTHLWITARMLHVYSVAAAMGRPGAYSLVDHGIKAMNGALRDKKYGGWYPAPSQRVTRKRASCSITPLKLSRNISGAKKSRCAWNPGTKPSAKPKSTAAAMPICTRWKLS